MKTAVLAAIAAALSFPVLAQNSTPRVEPRTSAVAAPVTTKPSDKATTPRENARVAKAQNKDLRCSTKEKQSRQKKATAT
jgi:hypothetical protein